MKTRRQREILGLIRSSRLRTQEELSSALSKRKIEVSQGTLSRDLRELGIVKTADGYALPSLVDDAATRNNLSAVAAQFLTGMRTAHNLVVLRTAPGGANALAQHLDAADWPDVVGTIAGDDTIFAATEDPETALRVLRRLEAL